MRDIFSTKGVFTPRNVTIMAFMAALTVVLRQFSVYITPSFRLADLTYLPHAVVSILFGPWAGLAFGLVADTAAYLYRPMGFYFVGYALSEMVGNFIYACFLYKRKVSVMRVLLARLLVVAVVIFGLNFLWQHIMLGHLASVYFTSARLVSNLIQFPVSVALIYMFGRLCRRLERRAAI